MARLSLSLLACSLLLVGAGCSLLPASRTQTGSAPADTAVAEQNPYPDTNVAQSALITVDAPATVSPGVEFTVTVSITNQGSEPMLLDSIDIADEYLTGNVHSASIPAYTETFSIDGFGMQSYTYRNLTIAPETTELVTLYFTAVTPGDWGGDLDVCVENGGDCRYLQVRTVIQ